MNRHLNDADLVALALLPDDSPEAKLHLAACAGCSDRMDIALETLDRHRSQHDDGVESRDATFWKRQELSVMREVARAGKGAAPRRGLVAAALVAVAIGGFWFGRSSIDETMTAPDGFAAVPIAGTSTAGTRASEPDTLLPTFPVSTDPWESDSLSEFQAVVDWESWVDENGKDQGTI
jgi:hypothetical protein